MTNAIPSEQRNWAMVAHLSSVVGWLTVPGIANIVAPLVIWLIKKDENNFATQQAKECLNFQISMTIYTIIAAILCLLLVGFILLPALLIFDIVVTIMGAIEASKGVPYRYPMTIRFIS